MLYKQFKEKSLSRLGFGAMRLPVCDDGKTIDEDEANRIIVHAHECGINYFDTAYSYHLQESERVLGRILTQFPRDSFNLASKFPGHEIRKVYNAPKIFEEQLEKCGVDRFDFYLLHNVNESSLSTYLDPRWGIVEYLLEQKAAGRIGHLGFSAHGRLATMERFLEVYGGEMEFCQIQLNYLDWTLQEAKAKYEMLTERGIPVWVMEPCRGGLLAVAPDKLEAQQAVQKLAALRPQVSFASWAFRWIMGLPNVSMVLSGMTTMNQLEDNLATFAVDEPLSNEERALLAELANGMLDILPCTACRYCCRECPQGLDIPLLLSSYNDARVTPTFTVVMAMDALPADKRPEACVACGSCAKTCPQGIDIPAAMQDLSGILAKMPRWADVRKYDD